MTDITYRPHLSIAVEIAFPNMYNRCLESWSVPVGITRRCHGPGFADPGRGLRKMDRTAARLGLLITLICCLLVIPDAHPAQAQDLGGSRPAFLSESGGGLEGSFVGEDENWWDGFGTPGSRPGPDGTVYCLADYGGTLVAGGHFTVVDGVAASNIVQWNGASWNSLQQGLNGEVRALTLYRGDLIAGGGFTTAGLVPVARIARWDGTSWHPLGLGMNGAVRALCVRGNELFAAGEFTTAGGVAAYSVARWDGVQWRPAGSGIPGAVYSLASYGNDVIAGGVFSSPGEGVARWNGSNWLPLGSGIPGSAIYSLVVYNNDLIVGGSFSAAGGVTAANIARWNGSSWFAMDYGLDMGGMAGVESLGVFGSSLIAAGSFERAGQSHIPVNNAAQWNGSSWSPVSSGIRCAQSDGFVKVYALAESGGMLYAGGLFRYAGDATTQNLAAWDGGAWGQVGTDVSGPGGLDDAACCFVSQGSDLIAGGDFIEAGGRWVNHVARWDGAEWQEMGTGIGGYPHYDWLVRSLTLFEGAPIAGIEFWEGNPPEQGAVYRWNGSSWEQMGGWFNGLVRSVTVFQGSLYVGGYFNRCGAVPVGHVAQWTGSSWAPAGWPGGGVEVLAVHADRLAGGGDQSIGTWDGPGHEWTYLGLPLDWDDPHDPSNATINSLASFEGELIAGGKFSEISGIELNRIARWDGESWRPLGSGMSGSRRPIVNAVASIGPYLAAGGSFTRAGSVQARNMARWDGAEWSTMGAGMDSTVLALVPAGNNLFAGGHFTHAGGKPSFWVGRWMLYPAGLEEEAEIPMPGALHLSFANPYRPGEPITIVLPGASCEPEVSIYDVQGRFLRKLETRTTSTGLQAFWDGRTSLGTPAARGIHYLRVRGGSLTATRSILLQNE
jgi:hypothetical protein